MKQSPTMEELKADIERLQGEIDAADSERGYCKIPFPPISDVWAEQVYKRNLADIKPFLADYVELVLAAKEIVPLGELERVNDWLDALKVAREANDIVLGATCTCIAVLLRIATNGDSRMHYANLADMIVSTIEEVPYSVFYEDVYKGDYDGNYDKYYAEKREELIKWHEN
ncbi:hypothetical protein [Lysinibacillus sphaericus]|uniref:Uncharacterized protein n=1 Tax=Lysinibacillus sphaericus OT4b.31 TaxID=1285586 RepID=R7ZJA2_LYSSH|nr:hypothetical protein [Lysinibacillus sphaericus]EON74131.1 hypothetical protein H131_01578 [Lysinibacillus sphaericus OT4b.31]